MSLWIKIKFFFAAAINFILPQKPIDQVPLNKLKLPPGFHVQVFAKGLQDVRSLAVSPEGVVFAGTRSQGSVYALRDKNKNQNIEADEVYILAEGLNSPNGVEFKNGDLYVAEVSRVIKFKNVVQNLSQKNKFEVVYDKLPTDWHHGWKYIRFGPEGDLYIPVGAPCNVCQNKNSIYASIHKLNLETRKLQRVAQGVRNSVGFDWHPETQKMYFTDNGRDWLGDDAPPCEVNRLDQVDEHFGFPFCHGDGILDPQEGKGKNCASYKKPLYKLPAHVAPLALRFYTGNKFPAEYKNQILIAEHGSWNRTKKSGYKVSLIQLDGDLVKSYQTFIEGWLNPDETVWGRPVDLLVTPEGDLLISDDFAGVIYKVTYKPSTN